MIRDPLYEPFLRDAKFEWRANLASVTAHIDEHRRAPSAKDPVGSVKKLAAWLTTQRRNYRDNALSMRDAELRALWEATHRDERYASLLADRDESWRETLAAVKAFIDEHQRAPRDRSDLAEKRLRSWMCAQRASYERRMYAMKLEDLRAEWEATLGDSRYARFFRRESMEGAAPVRTRRQRALPAGESPGRSDLAGLADRTDLPGRMACSISAIGQLHKEYLTLDPSVLHARFQAEPRLWLEYHATRKLTLAAYEPASIPANRIIAELDKTRTCRRRLVVDMGCGEAPIARHFANDPRFAFVSYDHHSGGDATITEADISAMPLADASAEIAIMSLAMWGPRESCAAYAREAHRVLESGGMFIVSDSTARWTAEPGADAGLMRALLCERFQIAHEEIGAPFCLFVCTRPLSRGPSPWAHAP
jgi:hypothetical protein